MRVPCQRNYRLIALSLCFAAVSAAGGPLRAELKTWDGKYSIDKIEVAVVYFLPNDREPLPDWKDRVSYFCRRAEWFHEREFQGQSTLKMALRPNRFARHDRPSSSAPATRTSFSIRRSARWTRPCNSGRANEPRFRFCSC